MGVSAVAFSSPVSTLVRTAVSVVWEPPVSRYSASEAPGTADAFHS